MITTYENDMQKLPGGFPGGFCILGIIGLRCQKGTFKFSFDTLTFLKRKNKWGEI